MRRSPEGIRSLPTTLTVFAVALVVAVTLSGCTAAGSTAAPTPTVEASLIEPTGVPSPPVLPADAPRTSRTITGEGFSIAVDPAFQQARDPATEGGPDLLLSRPSAVPQLNTGLSVVRDTAPESDVVAASYALEIAKRTVSQATDVQRSRIEWPGAQTTVLVQWTEARPTSGGSTVPVRYWQLNTQVDPELILVVVGFSPVSSFADSGIAEAISSFRPTA